MRHFIRVMRKHNLTNKKDKNEDKYKYKDNDKDKDILRVKTRVADVAQPAVTERSGSSTKGRTPDIRYFSDHYDRDLQRAISRT